VSVASKRRRRPSPRRGPRGGPVAFTTYRGRSVSPASPPSVTAVARSSSTVIDVTGACVRTRAPCSLASTALAATSREGATTASGTRMARSTSAARPGLLRERSPRRSRRSESRRPRRRRASPRSRPDRRRPVARTTLPSLGYSRQRCPGGCGFPRGTPAPPSRRPRRSERRCGAVRVTARGARRQSASLGQRDIDASQRQVSSDSRSVAPPPMTRTSVRSSIFERRAPNGRTFHCSTDSGLGSDGPDADENGWQRADIEADPWLLEPSTDSRRQPQPTSSDSPSKFGAKTGLLTGSPGPGASPSPPPRPFERTRSARPRRSVGDRPSRRRATALVVTAPRPGTRSGRTFGS